MSDHTPLVLKYDDWPEADRAAWDNLFTVGALFEDDGPCSHWAKGSRNMRRQSYGQWLSFLTRIDQEAISSAPGDRVTPNRIKAFIEDCEDRSLSTVTVKNQVLNLFAITKAMEPLDDWSWLYTTVKRLTNRANRHSLPAPHPIDARQIFQWSLQFMEETAANIQLSAKTQAIQFRQALMIGFLIAWPVRRRALLAMRVDHHIQRTSDGFVILFPAEDMKDGKGRSVQLQNALVGPMAQYLDIYRPLLVAKKQTDALWINQYGDGITPDGFSKELPRITERHLGIGIRTHAFRHIAATTIAERDPEHVNIMRDILGHSTLAMAERHYNRATGISSCNALQSLVEDIRKSVPIMGRAKVQLTPQGADKEPD